MANTGKVRLGLFPRKPLRQRKNISILEAYQKLSN